MQVSGAAQSRTPNHHFYISEEKIERQKDEN